MTLSRPFILRPIATSLLMIAILLVGLLAYRLLPVSALPEVDYPTIQVITFLPGASPEVATSGITSPLEKQFGQMPGLKQMTSSSSYGSSLITLQFSLNVSIDVAEQEVQAAINAAATYLPQDLPNPPIYYKVNPADAPIMTLALTSATMPMIEIENLAETRLVPKLSQLPGVGLVSINGGERPAIRVQVNSTTLGSYGLTLENVREQIAAGNVNIPKGNFDGPYQSYVINTNDQLLTPQDYKSLVLTYRNGSPIYLSNVAKVKNAAENTYQSAWMNTTPAIILNIQRQPGVNVIHVVDGIKQLMPQLKNSLPKSVNINILSDRTITIRASVDDAIFELVISVILVILVILVFLRNFAVTIIPGVAIPLSIVGTFAVMYLLGFSLNNLTLMALTIATGFAVDDAIVMIENISRYLEQGEAPIAAALKGAGQIGFTILSLTISLIAVLIPLLFMRDIIGRLFREFAITLSVTILISAVISLTLTPMLCSRLLQQRSAEPDNKLNTNNKFDRIKRATENFQAKVIYYYGQSLQWVLTHRIFAYTVFAITLIISGILLYFIPKGLFPTQDTGMILGISQAPQSISFTAMANRQEALARAILQNPAVANVASFIGIDGTNTTLNSGQILINLKPLDERAREAKVIQQLQTKLAQVPGIILYLQPVQDLTISDRISRAQYQYSLSAFDPTQLNYWSDLFINKLHKMPYLQNVASDQQNLGLETFITVDRDTASRLGISMETIDNTLYDAFGQRQISTMFTQLNQYHVVMEAYPRQQNPQALNDIYLAAANGDSIPLSVFSQVTSGTGPLIINRQNQFPVDLISFNLAPHATLSEAMHAIERAKQVLHIPLNVQTSFEGAAKVFQNSLKNEGFLVLAAIVVVYIVLGVLYESYIHPLTILSTLPSAALGALLALLLTRKELSVIALIGIILLIGIVMKNAIMMIDFALDLERRENKNPREAIYEACLLRFRPILMTTMTAMLAAVPLAIGWGVGSELRQPLGIAIIGGLIVSQLLTLYTTPIIYLAFDRLLRFLQRTKPS